MPDGVVNELSVLDKGQIAGVSIIGTMGVQWLLARMNVLAGLTGFARQSEVDDKASQKHLDKIAQELDDLRTGTADDLKSIGELVRNVSSTLTKELADMKLEAAKTMAANLEKFSQRTELQIAVTGLEKRMDQHGSKLDELLKELRTQKIGGQ